MVDQAPEDALPLSAERPHGPLRSNGWLPVGLAALGLAVAAVEAVAASRNPFGVAPRLLTLQVSLHVLVGLAFIASSLVALARRPQNKVGVLLAVVGFAWFLEGLEFSANPVAFSIGFAGAGRFLAPLAHLFLVFPAGSIRSRSERWLVVTIYGWAVVGAVTSTIFLDFQEAGCSDCPRNVFMVSNRPGLHAMLAVAEAGVSVTLAVLVFLAVSRHWRGVTGPSRRILQPVIWATGPAVAVVALFALADVGLIPPDVVSAVSPLAQVALAVLPVAFLVGLLRTRLDRSMLAELLVELRRPVPHGHLRDLLARALKDPSLELVFWLPESGYYVNPYGGRVTVPPAGGLGERRTVTVLDSGGQPVGALIHDEALLDDVDLVHAVGAAARLALENERLHAELRAQLEEVRASRARIVAATDEARRGIERDLHDGAQQRLLAVSLAIRAARSVAAGKAEPELDALLREATEESRVALAELRELAGGIHPVLLTDAGLGPALEALVRRASIPARLLAAPTERLPATVEAAAYFVVSEGLANVAKHAHASQAAVRAECKADHLVIEVTDDGLGGADASGSGLRGLEDRVASLGGTLHVQSAHGHGTRIVAEIPYAETAS